MNILIMQFDTKYHRTKKICDPNFVVIGYEN
jgi:hypothetical protein